MPKAPQTRVNPPVDRAARIRPGSAAAAFGALVGLAIGCAYLGGTVFQATGSYDWVWYIDIVLAMGAALVNLPIRETRLARPAAA